MLGQLQEFKEIDAVRFRPVQDPIADKRSATKLTLVRRQPNPVNGQHLRPIRVINSISKKKQD